MNKWTTDDRVFSDNEVLQFVSYNDNQLTFTGTRLMSRFEDDQVGVVVPDAFIDNYTRITRDEIVDWLTANYTENDILDSIQQAKYDFLPADWEEDESNFDDGAPSEDLAYDNYGNGEAEDQVRMEIERDLTKHFFDKMFVNEVQLSDQEVMQLGFMVYRVYETIINETMSETIESVFQCVKS